jgi:hypothetical protein
MGRRESYMQMKVDGNYSVTTSDYLEPSGIRRTKKILL